MCSSKMGRARQRAQVRVRGAESRPGGGAGGPRDIVGSLVQSILSYVVVFICYHHSYC